MRDLLPQINDWMASDKSVALATVIQAWGSAPRPIGSSMAVSSEGEICGSVSGGCIEGALADEARRVLASGTPKLVSFGVPDETAWSVGLSCGGRIEIYLEALAPSDPQRQLLFERILEDKPTSRAVVVEGPTHGAQLLADRSGILLGTLRDADLDAAAAAASAELFSNLAPAKRVNSPVSDTTSVFVQLHLPRPLLIIVGAVHVAIHLVALARRMGYQTLVIDPRTAFATAERFAEADRLISEWPQDALADIALHETTCFVFLSHDLKIDVPGLEIALASPARYIGALGSKKTHAKRVSALRELGVSEEHIARVSSPVGLDLGGRRAEEIALSIMAEIVAVRHGRR